MAMSDVAKFKVGTKNVLAWKTVKYVCQLKATIH